MGNCVGGLFNQNEFLSSTASIGCDDVLDNLNSSSSEDEMVQQILRDYGGVGSDSEESDGDCPIIVKKSKAMKMVSSDSEIDIYDEEPLHPHIINDIINATLDAAMDGEGGALSRCEPTIVTSRNGFRDVVVPSINVNDTGLDISFNRLQLLRESGGRSFTCPKRLFTDSFIQNNVVDGVADDQGMSSRQSDSRNDSDGDCSGDLSKEVNGNGEELTIPKEIVDDVYVESPSVESATQTNCEDSCVIPGDAGPVSGGDIPGDLCPVFLNVNTDPGDCDTSDSVLDIMRLMNNPAPPDNRLFNESVVFGTGGNVEDVLNVRRCFENGGVVGCDATNGLNVDCTTREVVNESCSSSGSSVNPEGEDVLQVDDVIDDGSPENDDPGGAGSGIPLPRVIEAEPTFLGQFQRRFNDLFNDDHDIFDEFTSVLEDFMSACRAHLGFKERVDDDKRKKT